MSKRTGTSNRKPAVTAAPAAGGAPKVTRPVVASQFQPPAAEPATPHQHGAGRGLGDGARVGRRQPGPVDLHQLKRCRAAVARAERDVEGARLARRRAGAVVEAVAPAEAVEPPALRLEEVAHGLELGEALHPVARLVLAAPVGPDRVALLGARAQRDDVGAPLGAAARAERHVGGGSAPR